MESRCTGIKCPPSLWLHSTVDLGGVCMRERETNGGFRQREAGIYRQKDDGEMKEWTRCEDRCLSAQTVLCSCLVLLKHSKCSVVDHGLRKPCYVIVIIVCLCKLVCDNMLR